MPANLLDRAEHRHFANTSKESAAKFKNTHITPQWSQAAILLVGIALGAAYIASLAYRPKTGLFDGFNVHLINMVSNAWGQVPQDHRGVLFGHKFFLLSLMGAAATATLLSVRTRTAIERFQIDKLNAIFIASVSFFLCCSIFYLPATLHGTLVAIAIAAAFSATLLLKMNRPLVVVLGTSAILAAVVPGLLLRPDFTHMRAFDIVQSQQHYAVFLSNADKMALGFVAPESQSIHYGVILPLMLAMFERAHGLVNFATLIHLAQIGQLLFLALTFSLLLKVAGRRPQFALFALLTVLPWFHCEQIGVLFPNHSGWRFLAVFSGLWVLSSLGKVRPILRFAIMGALSGFSILYNTETGITLTISSALALALYDADGPLSHRARHCLTFAGALAIAPTLYAVIYALFMGAYPVFLLPSKLANYLRAPEIITTLGSVVPIAWVMLLQSAYIVVRNSLTAGKSLSYTAATRVAIALTLMFWEMYYFNRPYYSNLLSCWALYSILLIDGLRTLSIAYNGNRRMFSAGALMALSLTTVIIPSVLLGYEQSQSNYLQDVRKLTGQANSQEVSSSIVSGVKMPAECGDFLLRKAQRLAKTAQKSHGQVSYVTIYSLLMPKESHIEQKFHHIDPYFGINFQNQYASYLRELSEQYSDYVLLDNTSEDKLLKNHAWHNQMLIGVEDYLLRCKYTKIESHDGWDVYLKGQD